MTLAPYLIPLILIHIHLHPPTLSPDNPNVQGVLMGTRYLSPSPFHKCCSLYLKHPFPCPQTLITSSLPHPSGLSREAASPGSLSSGPSQYPVHPLYHLAPLTLLVLHSRSESSPPQTGPGPSTSSRQPALLVHNFTSSSSAGQVLTQATPVLLLTPEGQAVFTSGISYNVGLLMRAT